MKAADYLAMAQRCGFVPVFEKSFDTEAYKGGIRHNSDQFYIYWHGSKGLLLEVSAKDYQVELVHLYFNYSPYHYLASVTRPTAFDAGISCERRYLNPEINLAEEIPAIEKSGFFVVPWVGNWDGYDWLLHWREGNHYGTVSERPQNYSNKQVREISLNRLASLSCYDALKGRADEVEDLKVRVFKVLEPAMLPADSPTREIKRKMGGERAFGGRFSGFYVTEPSEEFPHVAYAFVGQENKKINQLYPFSNMGLAIQKAKKVISDWGGLLATNWNFEQSKRQGLFLGLPGDILREIAYSNKQPQ